MGFERSYIAEVPVRLEVGQPVRKGYEPPSRCRWERRAHVRREPELCHELPFRVADLQRRVEDVNPRELVRPGVPGWSLAEEPRACSQRSALRFLTMCAYYHVYRRPHERGTARAAVPGFPRVRVALAGGQGGHQEQPLHPLTNRRNPK